MQSILVIRSLNFSGFAWSELAPLFKEVTVRILRSLYKGALLSFVAGLVGSALILAQTQTQPSQGSESAQQQEQDVVYTADEYAAYQKATEEPDPAKREDAIIAFVKANPKSSLVQYAIGGYLQLLQDYANKGEWAKVASAGEKLLSVKPDDASVMYQTGVAFFKTQQFAKAAEYLEKVYVKQPEPSIAFMLAVAFGNPPINEQKVVQYGEIACAKFEPKDCYVILTQMTRAYSEKKQWDKAAEYATKSLAAFGAITRPETASEAEWTEYINREEALAHAVLGRYAFEQEKWQAVLDNYSKAIQQYDKLPALNAEAYYYIGLTHWKLEKLVPAMKAFARGSVQKDAPLAPENLKQLTTLYKSQHNDSTAGMDEYIQEATQIP